MYTEHGHTNMATRTQDHTLGARATDTDTDRGHKNTGPHLRGWDNRPCEARWGCAWSVRSLSTATPESGAAARLGTLHGWSCLTATVLAPIVDLPKPLFRSLEYRFVASFHCTQYIFHCTQLGLL